MSNIDKQALCKAAIAATGGQWVFSRSGVNSNVQAPIELQKGGRALVVLCKLNNAGWSGQIQTENNAKFIAAASPETVLALLDELEAAEQRNAELVHNHRVHAARLIDERGQLKQRIAELEARTVNIPDLPADCDRTEAHFKYQEAIREAGIKIAAGIGEGE
ncbi:ead/Ea22-like family protein [Citrobacter koseri]|uniref:ead/Ea22-like family protein n=1 Tax=Citrobacter koseri TaxID=545 RepID=UPI001907F841|nr:ead/Ea22-like family protein [Citrobacter koseri]MBJ9243877.1 ead/Ea22-like family protein [Citrobacter koseri]